MPQLTTLPNLLSLSRTILALLMAWQVASAQWIVAAGILWLAIGTDVLDGYLARRDKTSSPLGGLLDHGSDAFFVTCTVAALVYHNWAPLVLAAAIPTAFIQYMLDSEALKGKPLRASMLGRYNGICYFVFAGFPVMQKALDITLLPFDWFIWLGWGLVITTLISMTDRLVTLTSDRPVDE